MAENIPKKNRSKIYMALAAIVAVSILLLWYFFSQKQKSDIKNDIKTFYELVFPGSSVSVISLEEESGIYKCVVKIFIDGQNYYREAFVTKDGEMITESVILMKKLSEQILRMKNFVDCLYDKGVRIYGVLNSTLSPEGAQATLIQLNLLGTYSGKIYVSCDEPNLLSCLNAGITTVPSVVIGNRIEPGVKMVEWFENETGCKVK